MNLVAALVAFLALAPKAVQLGRDPRNPALRATCGVLAALGVAEVVNWHPTYHALGVLTGQPNIARYLIHLCALVAAASIQSLFLHLSDPATARASARIRWLILVVVAAAMGVVFFLADFDVEDVDHFADRYGSAPWMREYMLAFLAYLTLAMADIMRMSLRYSRRLPASALRLGLRVLTAGALVGLAFCLHKAAFLIVTTTGGTVPWSEGSVSGVLIVLGILLVAAGLVIPSAAKAGTAVREWPGRYRVHRDLLPLWQAVHDLDPGFTLHPPRRLPPPSTIEVDTYRRVIEILDGLRQFAGHLDPAAAEGHRLPEAADAAVITTMIRYVRSTPPAQRRTPSGPGALSSLSFTEDEDIDVLARHLAAVSRRLAAPAEEKRVAQH